MNLREEEEEEEEELYCRRLLQVAKRQVLYAYIRYRQDDKICTPSPRPSQRGIRITIVSERLLDPFIAILAVSSADAQLSLSLGQHNTDQADVVRGLIKISAHISIYYISRVRSSVVPIILYPPHPHLGFSAFSAEVQIPNLT